MISQLIGLTQRLRHGGHKSMLVSSSAEPLDITDIWSFLQAIFLIILVYVSLWLYSLGGCVADYLIAYTVVMVIRKQFVDFTDYIKSKK